MKKILALVAMVAFGTANAQKVMDYSNYTKSELDSIAKVLVAERTSHTEEFATPKVFRFVESDETVTIDGEAQVFHPGDTVMLQSIKYAYDGVKIQVEPQIYYSRKATTKEVRDEETWDKLKHASVETRFAEEMAASSGRKRDTRWFEAVSGNDTLRIVRHGVDKNHWYVALRGDYQISEGCNAFGGGCEIEYLSDSFWFVHVGANITRNMLYSRSDNPGENYTSYAGYGGLGAKVDLGRRENITIAGYSDIRATWQKTNSREFKDEYDNTYMIRSTHSNYSPVFGAFVRYRFPDTRIATTIGGEWSQKKMTSTNSDYEIKSAWNIYFKVSIGLHGNYVRTTK